MNKPGESSNRTTNRNHQPGKFMKTLSNYNLKASRQSRLHQLLVGLIPIALVAVLAIGITTASGQSPPVWPYNVRDLGALQAKKAVTSVPAAINNKGLITGTSGMPDVDEAAFLY